MSDLYHRSHKDSLQRGSILYRGAISDKTMAEPDGNNIPYILGARMRRVNAIKREVLSRAGRYKEVYPDGKLSKDPYRVRSVLHVAESRKRAGCSLRRDEQGFSVLSPR